MKPILYPNTTKESESDNIKREQALEKEMDDFMKDMGKSYAGGGLNYDIDNLNDIDGVTWFIGNFTDAMVKSGTIDDYDAMFVKCFKKYFNL